MMRSLASVFALTCATVLLFASTLVGQIRPRNAGIGIRGTYWNMANDPTQVTIRTWPHRTSIEAGNGGVWLYFFSRLDENSFLEFSIGAVGRVESESATLTGQQTDITAVFPVVLGWRFDLIDANSHGALRPYLAFGGGAYWLSDISVTDDAFSEELVVVNSTLHAGGYLGGGLNFMLSSSFGLNFDLKKHFIDFNKKHRNSGYEYGVGLSFHWGRYRKYRR